MRKEYELKGGRPNPYAKRIGAEGHAAVLERFLRSEHFVKVDDDLIAAFPDDETVNETLRLALKLKGVLAKPKRSTTKSRSKKSA
ncbi:MAG: hypothetical protein FWD73_06460 [Polyangiaceae bacterium]|nr:hypothetical protein [Polyangiaceae bacterium]